MEHSNKEFEQMSTSQRLDFELQVRRTRTQGLPTARSPARADSSRTHRSRDRTPLQNHASLDQHPFVTTSSTKAFFPPGKFTEEVLSGFPPLTRSSAPPAGVVTTSVVATHPTTNVEPPFDECTQDLSEDRGPARQTMSDIDDSPLPPLSPDDPYLKRVAFLEVNECVAHLRNGGMCYTGSEEEIRERLAGVMKRGVARGA